MRATYNWTYRPGVTNKYGLTVPSGADNARPSGFCYVALFGNDANGNGSRELPYKTITMANSIISGSSVIIIGSGVYRESGLVLGEFIQIIGDGDVTFDISFTGNKVFSNDLAKNTVYNLKFIGNGTQVISGLPGVFGGFTDCLFDGCGPLFLDGGDNIDGQPMINCTVSNFYGNLWLVNNKSYSNCTFYKCGNVTINNPAITSPPANYNNIFSYCNISIYTSTPNNAYSLFFNCNFRFAATNGGGAVYPTVPTGYTNYSTIASLLAAMLISFPSAVNPFKYCNIADPLFNNPANGDFSLSKTSPAQNQSYFGTYIGALGVGLPILARAVEADGSFDFATNVNLTIADDSVTFTDDTIDAQIDTVPLWNQLGRIINSLPLFGFNADRNGQYVDSIPDLGDVLSAGDTMSQPASYLVIGGAITYNGSTYQPGDRFTTVSGTTTFITGVSGQVQEITEAPERHTIMARFQEGGTAVLDTDALVAGNWYFVVSGTATYSSADYPVGTYFKAIDTSSWSGTATVELAMPDETTLPFNHYDPVFQPTTNNVGDVRTGAVVRGNGDPAYVRGTGYEWPINSKHMQFRYYLRAHNLTP